jgi:hypothetical protein
VTRRSVEGGREGKGRDGSLQSGLAHAVVDITMETGETGVGAGRGEGGGDGAGSPWHHAHMFLCGGFAKRRWGEVEVGWGVLACAHVPTTTMCISAFDAAPTRRG